ncbi:MAG TPA: hypothetical protein ENH30_04230, partial [Nitrospirae bacterium]|nr:hypothetical protein [Nitrospirota bacterium]
MVSLKVLNLREDPIGYLAGQTIDDAASTLVVFPTARNIRFFRKTLSGMSGDRTVISPYCLEISRFINQCLDPGGKALVDLRMRPFYLQHGIGRLRREQLAGLFRDSSKKMQEDFFEFAAAGSRILRFLDEIHAEKITADKLTKVSLYTDYEKHINILKDIGDSYRNALEEDGLTDIMFLKMGGAFLLDWLEDFKKVHFLVGGYLTGFELDLIKTIGHKKDVEIIVRYEGEPDKQTKKIFEAFSVDAPSMKSAPFPSAIEIRAFEEAAAQFGFIVHAVEHALRAGIPPDHIVVVLPDENTKRILFSLERKRIFNYAMGLDLKDTVWYSFLKSVEILFAERIGSSQYRSEPVINFLTHPFIRNLPAAGHWIDDFISEIKRENRLILNKSDFCKTEILRDVFSRIKSLVVPEGDACSYGGFLLDIAGFMEELESMLNPEFLQTISRSPEFAESRNAIMTWLYQSATLFHDNELRGAGALICLSYLLRQLSALTYSDVAGGTITVMGMLETRNIAFRAVIIPDMNEEMIPPRNEKEMFLNTAIRERLGIPAARDREGLARHYFMSLIKNAEMVFLSYVERDDRPIRSRFIEEILIQTGHTGDDPEWLRRRSEYEGLVFDCVCPPVGASMTDAIRKDETVLKYIDRMTLTPYKLSTYRRCSYKFYLAHIKNLEEPVEISGALEAMDIGNLLHRALKDVYDSGKQFSDAGRL